MATVSGECECSVRVNLDTIAARDDSDCTLMVWLIRSFCCYTQGDGTSQGCQLKLELGNSEWELPETAIPRAFTPGNSPTLMSGVYSRATIRVGQRKYRKQRRVPTKRRASLRVVWERVRGWRELLYRADDRRHPGMESKWIATGWRERSGVGKDNWKLQHDSCA